MKIASIIFESLRKTGGYEIYTHNLLKSLAQRGHDVTLYLPRAEWADNRAFYDGLDFTARPLIPQTRFFFKHARPALHAWLRSAQARHGYDLWQVQGAYYEALTAEGLAGVAPLVLWVYGADIYRYPEYDLGDRRDPAVDRLIRRAIVKMDRVVSMTPTMTRVLQELGVDPAVVRSIPNGIHLHRFQRDFDRQAVRAAWNVAPDEFLILSLGRFHPQKGFSLIPEVARLVKEGGMPFKWLVVGRQTEDMLPLVREAGVQDVVVPCRDVGLKRNAPADITKVELPVDGVLELYAAADLFVFPSRVEGFPTVLAEAMASGLPVLTTDAPGCGEILEHGVHGLITPREDTAAMARGVLELMRHRERLPAYAANLRAYARQFDWPVLCDKYEALYRELADSWRKAGRP